MEQFLDHDNMQKPDQVVTTGWERFISLLVAFGTMVMAFFKAVWARGDYMPKLYTPTNPAGFNARIRDPATIVTNILTTTTADGGAGADKKKQEGAQTAGATNAVFRDEKEITLSQQQRETEPVSIRSFVEGRCPTMQKGTLRALVLPVLSDIRQPNPNIRL